MNEERIEIKPDDSIEDIDNVEIRRNDNNHGHNGPGDVLELLQVFVGFKGEYKSYNH